MNPEFDYIGTSKPPALSEWEEADTFQKWTFSLINNLLNKGGKVALQSDDLFRMCSRDKTKHLLPTLMNTWRTSTGMYKIPRLMIALWKAQYFEFSCVAVLSVFEALSKIASPVVLGYFLTSLSDVNSLDYVPFLWAVVLGFIIFLQSFYHQLLNFTAYRMGWNWKNATTALVYDNLFKLQTNNRGTSNIGTGNLVNLISNDVASLEPLAVFVNYAWTFIFEVSAVVFILSLQLNVYAAMAALGSSLIFIPIQVIVSRQYSNIKSETSKLTDKRVRHISEVIDGITTVKSYGWEIPFYKSISNIRNQERSKINDANICRSINYSVYFAVFSFSSFMTFFIFWYTDGTLTTSNVFTALSLLQALRQTIGAYWVISMDSIAVAYASCIRIENFLEYTDKWSGKGDDNSSNEERTDVSINQQNTSNGQQVDRDDVDVDVNVVVDVVLVDSSEFCLDTHKADNNDSQLNISNPMSKTRLIISHSTFTYGSQGDSDSDSKETVVAGNLSSSTFSSSSFFSLSGINFSACEGELVIVTGPVGSGKSSLLTAILGEIRCVKGRGVVRSESAARIAYCAQQPWIMAASVLANVTMAGQLVGPEAADESTKTDFKNPCYVDESLYAMAVEKTRLTSDFLLWPAYDMTEIGARGVSMSGGQKARVALARAIYSDADLYLLDDPLSAVDAHVGKALFFDSIINSLKNRGKTVILVTHQLQYLPFGDRVLLLNGRGEQTFFGTYDQLKDNKELLASAGVVDKETAMLPSSSEQNLLGIEFHNTPMEDATGVELNYDIKSRQNAVTFISRMKKLNHQESQLVVTKQGRRNSKKNVRRPVSRRQSWCTIIDEDRSTGQVTMATYYAYLTRGGLLTGTAALLIAVVGQSQLMIVGYWLSWWATESFGSQDQTIYPWIFGMLSFFSVLLGFLSCFLWYGFSLRASSSLHDSCLWSVLHSPLHFFAANPTGRILNRFTKDQHLADDLLPFIILDSFQQSLFCLSAVILICISLPWLIVMMFFLMWAFMIIRAKYVASSSEVNRMESVTRSPIFADFSATLDCLTTLRAFGLKKLAENAFHQQIDNNGRAYFTFMLINRWLGIRLDVIVSMVVSAMALLAAGLRHQMDPSLIGITMVYVLSVASEFEWNVRQSAQVETQMTSIERLCTYANLPAEEGYDFSWTDFKETKRNAIHNSNNSCKVIKPFETSDVIPAINDNNGCTYVIQGCVKGGMVDIIGLTVQYREDLDPVLMELTLHIPTGCKVGICGRTGSGKSSLLMALLRMNIVVGGDICVDGESLLSMSLERARSLVSIIPQEAHLFSGTVRHNLDPFSSHTDVEVWKALEDAHVKDAIAKESEGLGASVEEGGKNFSVGQRQLLSLARCILRESKVVLMDEVTASIDYQTDKLLQETIRTAKALKDATIITIAHRLRTIADSDLIAVIHEGELVETGSPLELLSRPESHFHKLVEQSNEYEEIMEIATASESV
eukprot:gene2395-4646_t